MRNVPRFEPLESRLALTEVAGPHMLVSDILGNDGILQYPFYLVEPYIWRGVDVLAEPPIAAPNPLPTDAA